MRKDFVIRNNQVVVVSEGNPSPLGTNLPGDPQMIIFSKPTEDEKAWLRDQFDISPHTLESALNPESEARLEIEDSHVAMLINVPKNLSREDNLYFGVKTLGLFLFPRLLIVVAPTDQPNLDEGARHHKINDVLDLLLRFLGGTIGHFNGHLRVIQQMSDSLEAKISNSLAKDYLLGMYSLEKSLVYYLGAIGANTVVLEKIRSNARHLRLDEDHMDFLEDLLIDIRQCNRLAEMYSNILSNLMDAQGSIANANLNTLMKRLTIINVVIMPLNLIAGIGGMSEFSAMTQGLPLWLSYSVLLGVFSVIGMVTYLVVQRMSASMTKGRRRKAVKRKAGGTA